MRNSHFSLNKTSDVVPSFRVAPSGLPPKKESTVREPWGTVSLPFSCLVGCASEGGMQIVYLLLCVNQSVIPTHPSLFRFSSCGGYSLKNTNSITGFLSRLIQHTGGGVDSAGFTPQLPPALSPRDIPLNEQKTRGNFAAN